MLLSFVVPEIILGVSLFLLFTNLLHSVFQHLGTVPQVMGLVTFQLSYPFIIVRARSMRYSRSRSQLTRCCQSRPVMPKFAPMSRPSRPAR
jgi:ABC-type spermidine/putrescine transport system permease subunit II